MTSIITPQSPAPNYAAQILFVIRNANFQLTSDQIFSKIFSGTKYKMLEVIAVQKSGAATVACVGGIYDAAAKGGNALVAATQAWVTLAAAITVTAPIAAIATTALTTAVPFLSLTTGSTGAVTADVFIVGYCLD